MNFVDIPYFQVQDFVTPTVVSRNYNHQSNLILQLLVSNEVTLESPETCVICLQVQILGAGHRFPSRFL